MIAMGGPHTYCRADLGWAIRALGVAERRMAQVAPDELVGQAHHDQKIRRYLFFSKQILLTY
jgi:hypothetical protein